MAMDCDAIKVLMTVTINTMQLPYDLMTLATSEMSAISLHDCLCHCA